MVQIGCSLFLLILTGSASAANCPDFFRFVDFGQIGRDGVMYRGGSFFRTEDLDGTPLLHENRTECLDVIALGKDGHGNPIPVVESIHYHPDTLPIGFQQLRVRALSDTAAAAEESAGRHRARLKQADIITTRGENYLCLADNAKELFSCQVTSPYLESTALVAYCEEGLCTVPLMAIDQQIAVSATWSSGVSGGSNHSTGADIADKIGAIQTFLSPLISLSP